MKHVIFVVSTYASRQNRSGLETSNGADIISVEEAPDAYDTSRRWAMQQFKRTHPESEGWERHQVRLTVVSDEFLMRAGWVRE